MNTLFTLKLTEVGRKCLADSKSQGAYLLSSTGFDTIHVLNIRTWRTRVLKPRAGIDWEKDCPRPAAVHLHDAEWICTSTDAGQNYVFSLNGQDLDCLQEAISSGLYEVAP